MKAGTEALRKKTRILGGSALLAFASFASPAASASPYTDHTLTFVGCLDNGACYAGLSTPIPAENSSCAQRTQIFWMVTNSAGAPMPGGAEMARIATAAFLAGKRVTVKAYPSLCIDGATRIEGISMIP